MREYYDLWDQFAVHLSARAGVKERVRRALIHRADRYLLTRRVRELYVISSTVQARLQKWGGYPSKVLYPPPPRRAYRNDRYGDYLFGVSRLTPLKRFDLVLRALAEPIASGIRCVIAGEGAQLDALLRLRRQLDLDDRVEFIGRVDEEQLLGHLGGCRAVVFPTFNEDYGFVTVEAFSSGKPVLTCHDSGGPSELVRDGVNGFVTEPTPEAMARAMRTIMDDRNLAARLGEAGAADAGKMTWEDAVARLLLP
jgi:glycosyltransferase involved in cell wall biosynthesis